jgi:HNH endonuclease
MTEQILTQEKLKTLLQYDPDTGVLIWRTKPSRGVKAGRIAGTPTSEGYIALQINKQKMYAHRAIWLYVHGVWPSEEIDHINRIRNDNRLCNLRLANRLENSHNTRKHDKSLLGHKGVAWHNRNKKWQVQMRFCGKSYYVGQFLNLQDAIQARLQAETKLYADHNLFSVR